MGASNGGRAVLDSAQLGVEVGAPLWYFLPKTRPYALYVGLGMHATIGLMFGPVIWFSLLMSVLLLGSFAPVVWLKAALTWIFRLPGAQVGEAVARS